MRVNTRFTYPLRMYLWWGLCTLYLHAHQDVPLVEFMYLVFTCTPGCTSGGVYVPCIYMHTRMSLWWSLCTLYLHAHQDVPLVEFMYLVFTCTPGCTSGGVYVPCIYMHTRMYLWWSLCTLYLHARQVRVTVGDTGLCCCARYIF